MPEFIPWNSQSLKSWGHQKASGQFIELDGNQTHYVKAGQGEPLILLHGFFFDTNLWAKNIDALAENFTVYALDLWGFGYSTRQPLDYGYALYTHQLQTFMDTLDIDKAHLMGQSMGGGTIMNFTLSNRDRAKKMVLVNAAGLPNPLPIMGRISNLPFLGEFMYGINNDFMRKYVLKKNFIYNKELLTTEFYNQLTEFHKIKGSTEVMLSVTRRMFFDSLADEIERLGQIDVSSLIVWGENETSIPLAIGKDLHQKLPHSQFVALPKAGHCSNVDQAEHFNRLAIEFLLQ